MGDDVTIARETAKEWAEFIRNNAGGGRLAGLDDLADILDPPQRSLLDEMVAAHAHVMGGGGTVGVQERAMDAALAVVRERMEGLTVVPYAGVLTVELDVVLALLGGDESEQDYDAAPLMPSRASEFTESRAAKPRTPEVTDE